MTKSMEEVATLVMAEILEGSVWREEGGDRFILTSDSAMQCMKEYAASYQSQNSVSKEHYDELKLNYDIMVEENKRLNERERELVEALELLLRSAKKANERYKIEGGHFVFLSEAISHAEAALSNHKP